MKKYFEWNIIPLQNRIQNKPPAENGSFFRASSIMMPIILYNLVSQFFIVVFSYFMQWISIQNGGMEDIADWLRSNSVPVSGAVKGLSMMLGTWSVFGMFLGETPVIRMPVFCKKDSITVFLLGGCAALTVNILMSLLHITTSSESYEQVAQQQFALPVWAGIVLYGIISPLAEEVLFRGLVYNRLYRQYSKWMAVIGSSLLFGVYHGNLVQMIYGFLLGLLMVVLYEKYGSFLVPVLMHSGANIFVYVATSSVKLQKIFRSPIAFIVCFVLFSVLLARCLSQEKEHGRDYC